MNERGTSVSRVSEWSRGTIAYRVDVPSFFDADGDGIGDLPGLERKLGYVRGLGADFVSLARFRSCARWDPHEETGLPLPTDTIDLRELVRSARAQGLSVVLELGIDHTSATHPWFERARRARPGSDERRFYIWHVGERPPTCSDASTPIDNWAWDGLVGAWYRCGCCSRQPRLALDEPIVLAAVAQALAGWFETGVEGLWLHHAEPACGVPAVAAAGAEIPVGLLLRRGASPTHALRRLTRGDRFGCVASRSIIDAILEHRPGPLREQLDEGARPVAEMAPWTALPRVASLLGNDRAALELYHGLLLSLPGPALLTYGDEIGMTGEHCFGAFEAARTVMPWSATRNAGFSNAPVIHRPLAMTPGQSRSWLNVENQKDSSDSLLSWISTAIAVRGRLPALALGSLRMLRATHASVLAYVRCFQGDHVLVVANLAPRTLWVDLDTSELPPMSMTEASGETSFPSMCGSSYRLTLGPRTFYWLQGSGTAP